jgi:hypothetical protein
MKLMPIRLLVENGLKLRTKVGLPLSPPKSSSELELASPELFAVLFPQAATPNKVAAATSAAEIRIAILFFIIDYLSVLVDKDARIWLPLRASNQCSE